VKLLDYHTKKTSDIGTDRIIIKQTPEGYKKPLFSEVRIEVRITGWIIIDLNVTGYSDEFIDTMQVAESNIIEGIKRACSFVEEFWKIKDPHKRYSIFIHNASLANLGYRSLVPEIKKMSSYTMGQYGDKVFLAFSPARKITREDFKNIPENALTLLKRQLKS
jgi:hypothetical protein